MSEKQSDINTGNKGVISSEEFQNKLVVWFEERGILNELRTHLRHQMIEKLKSSNLGRKISLGKKSQWSLSPKQQAINLLIAEYLLNKGYQYSMCVFSSEVGTLYSLPQHTQQLGHQVLLPEKDVRDILEALGLHSTCEETGHVVSAYSSGQHQDCLLECLLRTLPASLKNKLHASVESVDSNHQKVTERSNNGDVAGMEYEQNQKATRGAVQKRDAEVQSEDHLEALLCQIHRTMQEAFDHEMEIVREEEKQHYEAIMKKKDQQMEQVVEHQKMMTKQIEDNMREEMEREMEEARCRMNQEYSRKQADLERELELDRCRMLNQYKEMLGKNLQDGSSQCSKYLSSALDMLQKQSNKLAEKEHLLERRIVEVEERLSLKSKAAGKSSCAPHAQNDMEIVRKVKHNKGTNTMAKTTLTPTDYERSDANTQTECEKVRCQQTQTDERDSSLELNRKSVDEAIVRSKISDDMENIQKENSQLRMLTGQQNSKIEEMRLAQSTMSGEMSMALAQVKQLSRQLGALNGSHTLASSMSSSKQVIRELLSGKSIRRHKRHSSKREDCRHKRGPVTQSTSEESLDACNRRSGGGRQKEQDESPIEEAVRDARKRLKILELETEAVDRSYQEFKLRQKADRSKVKETTRPSVLTADCTDQPHKIACAKEDLDEAKVNVECLSPVYNTFRRVLQPSMNVDNTFLQRYLQTNITRQHHVDLTNRSKHNSHINKFTGTTALLLKRIQNYSSNISYKYNIKTSSQGDGLNTPVDTREKHHSHQIEKISCVGEDYSKYIGNSHQQYKIKPYIHWRNIQSELRGAQYKGTSHVEATSMVTESLQDNVVDTSGGQGGHMNKSLVDGPTSVPLDKCDSNITINDFNKNTVLNRTSMADTGGKLSFSNMNRNITGRDIFETIPASHNTSSPQTKIVIMRTEGAHLQIDYAIKNTQYSKKGDDVPDRDEIIETQVCLEGEDDDFMKHGGRETVQNLYDGKDNIERVGSHCEAHTLKDTLTKDASAHVVDVTDASTDYTVQVNVITGNEEITDMQGGGGLTLNNAEGSNLDVSECVMADNSTHGIIKNNEDSTICHKPATLSNQTANYPRGSEDTGDVTATPSSTELSQESRLSVPRCEEEEDDFWT